MNYPTECCSKSRDGICWGGIRLDRIGWYSKKCTSFSITQVIAHDQTSFRGGFNVGSNRGSFQARGRGRRPFVRQSSENDPHDMSIAPMFIYENQVLPIGIHNLSKSFRPNLATIRVLSLGTKFSPKWKLEKRNNVFKYFNNFIRNMNNKIYFTETKLGVFERNARFEL